jgi:hypothetical protein
MAPILDKQYSLQMFYHTFVCFVKGALWNIYNTSTTLLEKSSLTYQLYLAYFIPYISLEYIIIDKRTFQYLHMHTSYFILWQILETLFYIP